MTEKVLFFFSALGVFNALLLAIYLLAVKSQKQAADYLLGFLITLLVIRVGVSCFNFFGAIPTDLIRLGLVANLLLGPTMWLLMSIMSDRSQDVVKVSLWTLGLWFLALLIAWMLFDFPTWNWYIRYVIHAVLTAHLVYIAFHWRKELDQLLRFKPVPGGTRKGLLIFLSLAAVCVGFAVSLFSNYILGPLIFSAVFNGAAGYFLFRFKEGKAPSPPQPIDQQEFGRLNGQLIELMEKDRLYRDPNLSLESLAKRLSVSRHLLSRMLNNNLHKNFHHYINDYRIREACELLKDKQHFSIEAIGHEVGFNSRSSFFTAFKKQRGMTPAAYRMEG
ncbi:MAG: AraC family transcriptional regulator [Bacteroidota bacterium]